MDHANSPGDNADKSMHSPIIPLQRRADGFYFRVLLQDFVAHFATPAGLLVSAEGQCRVKDVVAVNPDRAGAELGGQAMRLRDVARPDSGGQAIGGGVGLFDQFGSIAERNRRDHGAEDFFLHDFHAVVGINQNGRLYEIAFVAVATSTSHGLGTFGKSGLEESANPIQLLGRNQRTHFGGGIHARSNIDFAGMVGNAFDDFVENTVLDVETGTGAAALSVIEEDGAGCARNRGVDVHVGEDNIGRLSTKFQRNFFQIAGSGLQN